MSRTIAILLLPAALLACNKAEDTDTGVDDDSDTEQVFHPLVPEKYKYLWDTDGCVVSSGPSAGSPGIQIYVLSDEGEASSNGLGRFEALEHWFWFKGGDWASDCVDTFRLEGEFATFDYGTFGASQAEEGWLLTRTLVDANCGVTYYTLLGLDPRNPPPDEEIYGALLFFDTLTPSGEPNVDNAMLVFGSTQVSGYTYTSPNVNYARGHAYPEGEPGYPAAYDWLGSMCVGTGR